MGKIFIPGNVPSLKNGKNPVTINGRTVLIKSDSVKKYLKSHGIKDYKKTNVMVYARKKNTFLGHAIPLKRLIPDGCEFPIWIGFHFVRDSIRKFDFNNANHLICDLLVAHKIIPEDDMDHVLPEVLVIDGRAYSIDRKNPGVFLTVRKFFRGK